MMPPTAAPSAGLGAALKGRLVAASQRAWGSAIVRRRRGMALREPAFAIDAGGHLVA